MIVDRLKSRALPKRHVRIPPQARTAPAPRTTRSLCWLLGASAHQKDHESASERRRLFSNREELDREVSNLLNHMAKTTDMQLIADSYNKIPQGFSKLEITPEGCRLIAKK